MRVIVLVLVRRMVIQYIYIYTPEYMTGTRFTGRQQYDEHTHQAYNPIRDTSSMITQSRRTQL